MRVRMSPFDQRELIYRASLLLGSIKSLAFSLGVPYSTFKNYYQSQRSLPKPLFDQLVAITNYSPETEVLSDTWGNSLGGQKGMHTLQQKYPSLLKTWRHSGFDGKSFNKKTIAVPELNESLAEFIGICIGDGTLTKYFLRISGDKRYDLPYFEYIALLTSSLFNLSASIIAKHSTNNLYLTICSVELSKYLQEEFKLPLGDKIKNRAIIPSQILASDELSLSCIRGLMDTDGTFARRGRMGTERCLVFSSHNKTLLCQVDTLTKKYGLFNHNSSKGKIGTNAKSKILLYFSLVGSSNMKHIVRFEQWKNYSTSLYVSEVILYYQKPLYKELSLPFYSGP